MTAPERPTPTPCGCRVERAAVEEPMVIVKGIVEHHYRPERIVYCARHASVDALVAALTEIESTRVTVDELEDAEALRRIAAKLVQIARAALKEATGE